MSSSPMGQSAEPVEQTTGLSRGAGPHPNDVLVREISRGWQHCCAPNESRHVPARS